jgi:hypothetical protein
MDPRLKIFTSRDFPVKFKILEEILGCDCNLSL